MHLAEADVDAIYCVPTALPINANESRSDCTAS